MAGVPLGIRLHPTQVYESMTTLALFSLLLWWFPRKRRDGDVFLTYVGLYAVGRFFLEFLRGDEDRGFVFRHLLSTSQFIALVALAGVTAAIIWRYLHPAKELSTIAQEADEQCVPKTGQATQPGKFRPAPTVGQGVEVSKGQTVAVASVPKRVKR